MQLVLAAMRYRNRHVSGLRENLAHERHALHVQAVTRRLESEQLRASREKSRGALSVRSTGLASTEGVVREYEQVTPQFGGVDRVSGIEARALLNDA
jgi:hypothetical protein